MQCGVVYLEILLFILLQQLLDLYNQVGDVGMHSSTELLSSSGEIKGERSSLDH